MEACCVEMKAIYEVVGDENQSTSKEQSKGLGYETEEGDDMQGETKTGEAAGGEAGDLEASDPQADDLNSIRTLLFNVPYMCCVLTISIYFFVISGLQYWISDYFVEVIGMTVSEATIYFSTISITAPIFGSVFSGMVGSRIGGHESPVAIPSCVLSALMCALISVLVPFCNTTKSVCFLLWVMLFLGGYMLPLVTGIMLGQVDQDHKAKANSLANLCYNLIGYMPAPTIYGAVCSLTGGKQSRWGMIVLMSMTIPPLFFLFLLQATKKESKKPKTAITETLLEPRKLITKRSSKI